MKVVNIFVVVDSANARKSKKKYGYVMECEVAGESYTKEGFGEIESTYHGVTLHAMNQALGRMKQGCEIHIYTENTALVNLMDTYMEDWAAAGFVNGKNEPISNQEEWQQLWGYCQQHLVIPIAGHHTFSKWLETQIKED